MSEAPAVGTLYRKRSTGRIWHLERISDAGLLSMDEDFYGPGCVVRDYVTPAELAEGFDAVS